MNDPTVFLVDDDPAVRDSLSLLLSMKGIRTQVFGDGESFLQTYKPEWRGCVLSDLRMPRMSGLALLAAIRDRGWALPVVMLTAHGDVPTTRLALKSGAFDFLEKPVDDTVLLDVLRNAIEADAQRHRHIAEREAAADKLSRLTPRERQVLGLIAEGMQNREIGEALGISPRTVEVYKARVMEKLNCRNVADIVRLTLASPVD